MALSHTFQYARPASLDEAAEILARSGPAASVLAGGTDLVGWIHDDMAAPELLVDIKAIPGLDRLELRDGVLRVGARVTFARLAASPEVRAHFILLWEAARVVGTVGIRHRATMVGNICTAVPCCDSGTPLLVYEAVVRTVGPGGERRVPIGEWFLGNRRTARIPGELVVGVDVPLPPEPSGGCFVKLRRSRGADLAQSSVSVLALGGAPAGAAGRGLPGPAFRIAFGAVADRPRRAARIEALLAGRELTAEAVREAQALVDQETAPITDARATGEYRLRMSRVMLARALQAAVARLAGEGPAPGAQLI